jgi:hypothetical protein
MARKAFQVVELVIDANDQVIDRKAIPYPYPTQKDAVDTIESLATKLAVMLHFMNPISAFRRVFG